MTDVFDFLPLLRRGVAIPAHPLALDARRRLGERHQRGLTRYYLAAGAGGLAVGVHTTQFAIRDPRVGLFEPVLALAAEEMDRAGRPVVRVAGICGETKQAVAEAETIRRLGYHAGLLSLAALPDASEDELIAHCRAVADVIPVIGFYLQPSVGGRVLRYAFWRRFAEIDGEQEPRRAEADIIDHADLLRGHFRAQEDERQRSEEGQDGPESEPAGDRG